jgi:hypothetical protein
MGLLGRTRLDGHVRSSRILEPKVRAADCLNPPAARSILPYAYKRTEMLLAGHSKQEVIAAIKSAIDKKELPALERERLAT